LTKRTSAADSPTAFLDALGAIASGVCLVTMADGRDDVGLTVSAFCPVSLEPALILVALMAESYPAELLGRLDRFAVSGRPGARLLLDDVPHHRGAASGALIADGGLAALECEVADRVPAGDHLLVIARVVAVDGVAESGSPLIRFRGRYPAIGRP